MKDMSIHIVKDKESSFLFSMDPNQQGKQKGNGNSIVASSLNRKEDPIEQKRKEAREEAMKHVRKAFERDNAVSDSIQSSMDFIKQTREENLNNQKEIQAIEEEKAKILESFGGDEEAEDYKEAVSGLNQQKGILEKEIQAGNHAIEGAVASIFDTKQEALKSHGMVDAQKTSELILDAASKEIIGMLKQEAIDTINEKMEEEKKKAEEKKEKEEELEEIKEAREEQKEEQQERIEKIIEKTTDRTDLEKELEDILKKQKLLEEDLKGISVDDMA